MAIGKGKGGKGFKGAALYILKKKDAEFLYGRGVVTQNPSQIANQMRVVADMRKLKNPVMHFSIALGKGERGTPENWQKAADAFLIKMGFDLDQTQYIVARHNDTQHDHIHILVNRVQLNNTVVSDFQLKQKTHEATRAAELAGGFRVFESQKAKELMKDGVRQKIDMVMDQSKNPQGKVDYPLFKTNLAKEGVTVNENRSPTTGRLNGISFKTSETHTYKASSLGKEYGLGGLEKRGLHTGRTFEKTSSKSKQQDHQQRANGVKLGHAAHQPTAASAANAGAATQARVNAQQNKKDSHTAQAKGSQAEDERKRLQGIKHAEREDEDEL